MKGKLASEGDYTAGYGLSFPAEEMGEARRELILARKTKRPGLV